MVDINTKPFCDLYALYPASKKLGYNSVKCFTYDVSSYVAIMRTSLGFDKDDALYSYNPSLRSAIPMKTKTFVDIQLKNGYSRYGAGLDGIDYLVIVPKSRSCHYTPSPTVLEIQTVSTPSDDYYVNPGDILECVVCKDFDAWIKTSTNSTELPVDVLSNLFEFNHFNPKILAEFLYNYESSNDAFERFKSYAKSHASDFGFMKGFGPMIKKVYYNNPYTTVLWSDNTVTVVKVRDVDEFDEEVGLAMCIARKFFEHGGNNEHPRAEFKKTVKEASRKKPKKTKKTE